MRKPITTFRAFNTITGLWYRVGEGFTAILFENADKLDSAQLAVVRFSFLNVGVEEQNL